MINELIIKFRHWKWKKIIKKSGIFDSEYYLLTYPDVKHDGIEPIMHYIKHGVDEKRNPSKTFNTGFYLNRYLDVKKAQVNPLVHYIITGKDEGRLTRDNCSKNEADISAAAAISQSYDIKLSPEPHYDVNSFKLLFASDRPFFIFPYTKFAIKRNIYADVGIHLHLFYYDLLDEFIDYFKNFDFEYSLYVSVVDEKIKENVYQKLAASLINANINVKLFENKGRDIAPFICGFKKELLKHQIIAHFHTKKSPHSLTKAGWRQQLLSNLIGSKTIINQTVDYLQKNKNIGIIFPVYHYSLKNQISWGNNFKFAQKIANKMGITISEDALYLFPAGSMFWARTDSLKPLFDANFTYDDFSVEISQVDNTLAHAIERLFGEIVHFSGYEIQQIKSNWLIY